MPVTQAFDFFVQWHLTERCNLRCAHCYQEGRDTDEMASTEVKEAISEVSGMLRAWKEDYGIEFSPSFNVTGGEPFLRQDIFEIFSEMREQGFDLYILSNGILITPEKARALSTLGVKGVQVSIEGPEAIHDEIRGKGSFSSSLTGIRELVKEGVPVSLNATLSKLNASHFMDMIGLASSLGVRRLGFSRLVPSGRGSGMLDKMLDRETVRDLYEAIFSVAIDGLDIVTGDPVASQMAGSADIEDAGNVPLGGCAAGVSGLTILPDGTITPCRRLNVPIGNLREDSLREVWAMSPVLEALRDRSRYKGRCGACRRWAHCRGCRAIAFAYARSKGEDDFLAEDPQCFIGE